MTVSAHYAGHCLFCLDDVRLRSESRAEFLGRTTTDVAPAIAPVRKIAYDVEISTSDTTKGIARR